MREHIKHLKKLLPSNHPIRVKAREHFKQALETYEDQKNFVKEKYNYFLLVSDNYFAEFKDNRVFGTQCKWPTNEFPRAYFLIAPKQEVMEKPQTDKSKEVPFNDFDFNGYRAATILEASQWLEYTDHLFDLQIDMLPF